MATSVSCRVGALRSSTAVTGLPCTLWCCCVGDDDDEEEEDGEEEEDHNHDDDG